MAYFTYIDLSLSKRIVAYSVAAIYFSWQYVRISIMNVNKTSRKITLGVGLVFAGYILTSLIRIVHAILFYEKGTTVGFPTGTIEAFSGYIQQSLMFL